MAMASKSLNTLIFGSLLRKNLVANYFGSSVLIIGPLISLPFYLAFLGSHEYGLIGFILLLQSSLNLLDVGLGQALVREFSSSSTNHYTEGYASRLVSNLERMYWLCSLVIALVMVLLSTFISTHWLKLDGVSLRFGIISVCGAALIFLFQFPGAFYRNFLVGYQAQLSLNKILIVANIFRHAGGVILVYLYPSVSTYIAWQVLVALLETIARRAKAWELLGGRSSSRQEFWHFKDFIHFFKLIRGLTVAIWVGALLPHLDKLILSKMVSIKEFGYYTIASSVSLGVLQLIYPILQAAQPKAITLRDDPALMRQFFMKLFLLIVLVFSVVILGFFLVGQSLIGMWLRHADAAKQVYEYCSFLLIGTAFHALYSVGYMDWVVRKKARNILALNFFSIVLMIILLPIAINHYGVRGAALGWVTINLAAFMYSLGWLKRVRQ
jgi:O-antigen/teichoic acid export membrane protein